ncbi:MAG: hypothetical protein V3W51_04165 [Candidatus Brocadiales bacterium]
MYQEHSNPSPKDVQLDVGTAIDQVASHIPLKAFRKQGLSEVRVISEKTLGELVEKAVDAELQKRFDDLSRERDELRTRSEALSRQLAAIEEGSGGLSGEKEELEKSKKALEEEVARLRSRLDAEKTTFTGATSAKTSVTKEKYEEKLKEVIENILEGARGTIPVDLFENVKKNLLDQLVEKFPHTTSPLRVISQSEAAFTSQPQPVTPTSGTGPIKPGSLFHKLVESNVQWRHKQKTQKEEQKGKEF